ncbi:LamG-like jellyroll fold domain-containing protein [Aeoliella mucimassa]|uniref:FecR protein n=1 Tax=Aeoliella mucimassa TaxID=2527972 RepID=A0A518APE9_9BACT|nr:LamG-like jellyroll fold domain-containing protein [Aeoliella mucimassa]QDU56584.1 FecR protein [Aeoliella mucimassa]
MNIPEPIHDHLEDYLDGNLSEQGFQMISVWVNEQPDAAEALSQWLVWQVSMRDLQRIEGMQAMFADESTDQPASAAADADSLLRSIAAHELPATNSQPPSAAEARWWNSHLVQGMLAASLALVMGWGVWTYIWSGPGNGNQVAIEQNSESDQKPVAEPSMVRPVNASAYLGRLTNCEWTKKSFREGTALVPGSELSLEEGRAELIFDSGAKVSARGPCTLKIDDDAAFTLVVGDVSVEASFGFKVSTPSGVVIDLGTAFGVSVDSAGGSEVHVFEGEVAFQARGATDSTPKKSIVLQKDQACRYSVGGISLDEFKANESKFAWRSRELLSDDQVPDLQIRDGLVLWLAADRFVETDDQNGVICWRDLLVVPNSSAEDALQPAAKYRPVLTEDGLNGKPSLRFGGEGAFLLTPPLYTANEQTAFVVFALNDANPVFQPILNYNGPPQRIPQSVGDRVDPGVFQIFARDGNRDGRHAIIGHVFSGYEQGSRTSIVSEVGAFERAQTGEPLVVGFRHNPESRTLSLYVNGQEAATQQAVVDVGGTSRKLFGQHPIYDDGSMIFHGDLGEVLIFNRSLSDREVVDVSSYLIKRFDLE